MAAAIDIYPVIVAVGMIPNIDIIYVYILTIEVVLIPDTGIAHLYTFNSDIFAGDKENVPGSAVSVAF